MTEFELQVLSELSTIKSTGAATAARLEEFATNAAIENKQCFEDRARLSEKFGTIAEMQTDIAEIKAEKKDDKRWERIHNIAHYSMTPLLVFIHAVARHLGMEI